MEPVQLYGCEFQNGRFNTHLGCNTYLGRFSTHLGRFSTHQGRFSTHQVRFSTHLGRFSTHQGRFSTHLGCNTYLPVRTRVGSAWSSPSSADTTFPFGCGGPEDAVFLPSCRKIRIHLSKFTIKMAKSSSVSKFKHFQGNGNL